MDTNILILAAGQGAINSPSADYPLCLSEINGFSLLEKIIGNTQSIAPAKYYFALLQKEVEHFHLDKIVSLLTHDPKIVMVPEATKGAACTALLAASQIDLDGELLIISANELVDCDLSKVIKDFRARDLHAGTLTFRSIHPRYSYVKLDKNEHVVEATQQNPISHHATVGIFWFKRVGDFIQSAKDTIRKNAVISDRFYLAPIFNEMILKGRKIGIHRIENDKYLPFKTDQQIRQLELRGQI